MTRVELALVGLLTLLFLAPQAASAGPDEFSLRTSSAILIPEAPAVSTVRGEVSFTPATTATLVLESAGVTGTLYESSWPYARLPGGRVSSGEATHREYPVSAGGLAVETPSSASRVLVVMGDNDGSGGSAKGLGPLAGLEARGGETMLFPEIVPGSYVEAGSLRAYAATGPRAHATGYGLQEYTGPIEVYFWETPVQVKAPDGSTRTYESGNKVETPSASSNLQGEREVFLRFKGTAESLSLSSDHILEFWLHEVAVSLSESQLTIPAATGSVAYDGRTHAAEGQDVVLEVSSASLRVAVEGPETLGVDGAGDLSGLVIGGSRVTTSSAIPAAAGTAAAGLAAATVLAAIGAILYHFKVAPLFPFALRHAAREHGGSAVIAVLRNDARRKIFELIRERPGIQPFHIWKEVGGALGVTNRALARLEEVGLIRTMKVGKNRHCYENSPKYSGPQADLLAALSIRTVGETYQALKEMGSATQKQLRDALRISLSSVSERLGYMVQQGLVIHERRGRVAFYVPIDLRVPASYFGHTPRFFRAVRGTEEIAPQAVLTPMATAPTS